MNLVGPDGKAVWVDDAFVEKAKAQGYRDATADEVARAKAGEEPGTAFAQGAARTVLPGVFDTALQGYYKGRGMPEYTGRLIKEENPTAATAGELAGSVLPGAPTLIGKAGAGAAGLATSKMAQRALQGGVETGLYGLSNGINESVMGDPKLASEHMAAETLGATLLGAGANVVLGKMGDVGKSVLIKAFGGKAFKQTLDDLAEKAFLNSITVPSDLAKKNTRANFSEIARFGLDEGMSKFEGVVPPSKATVAQRGASRAEQAWNEMDQQLAAADTLGHYDPGKTGTRMQARLDQETLNNPALYNSRQRAQDFVNQFFDQTGQYAPGTFRKAHETSKALLKSVGEGEPTGLKDLLFSLREELQGDLADQIGSLDPQLSADFKRSTRDYYLANRIGELATKAADKAKGVNLYDAMAAMAGFAHGGPVGLVTGAAAHEMRHRGGFALATALDSLASNQVMPRVAAGFKAFVQSTLQRGGGGAFRAMLENAAAKGADALLITHLQHWSDPEYRAALGLEAEPSDTVPEHIDRAHRLSQLAGTVDDRTNALDTSINRLLGTQGGRAPTPRLRDPSKDEYEKLVKKLELLKSDPDIVKRQLSELAPTTSALAGLNITSAASFLISKAPKNPNEQLPPALQTPWAPSKSEMRTWYRYVEAVADPESVIEDMRRGTVTPEAMEALRTAYPRLVEEFKSRMLSRISDQTKPLSRKIRNSLNVLAGNVDDPQVVAVIQAAHQKSAPPNPNMPDGRQKIDADKNAATQAQRLEEKP